MNRDGRVEFTGFSGTDLLGPHCGTLDPKYVDMILSVADRANLMDFADRYDKPAMDAGGRLVVYAKWLAMEKLIGADGASKPPVLVDLSILVELATTQVHWTVCERNQSSPATWGIVGPGVE